MQRGDFLPGPDLDPTSSVSIESQEHRCINISGLMFEIPVPILKRDKDSLLAQIAGPRDLCPVTPDPEGFYYFDRDW